jgi:hypothetical protein
MSRQVCKKACVAVMLLGLGAGCATPARQVAAAQMSAEERLPASYPRLEDFGLKADRYDVKEREPYNHAVDRWFAPPPAGQPQPKLVCDEPNAPVQTIWKGQDLTSAWEIRNEGGGPLRVSFLPTCKGCVRGPAVREIAPGGRSIVQLQTRWCRTGRCSDTLGVRTNDPATPKLVLRAEAKVRSALRSADGQLPVDFGTLPRDAGPQKKTVFLERGDGGPLEVKLLAIAPARASTSRTTPHLTM